MADRGFRSPKPTPNGCPSGQTRSGCGLGRRAHGSEAWNHGLPGSPRARDAAAHPMSPRRLHVLVAPDSFKGSLTSGEVARALADGWHRARPDDEIRLAPLAHPADRTLL